MAAPEGKAQDEAPPFDWKLDLAQKRFLYKQQPGSAQKDSERIKKDILEIIYAHNAAPLYKQACAELAWPVDEQRLGSMQQANAKRLAELDEKIKDAEENLGDQEVRAALAAKADYLCELGGR